MSEVLHPIQFNYERGQGGRSHALKADLGDDQAIMLWTNKRIIGLQVPHEHQRKGIATAMWHEGHRLASENQQIPKPRHSDDRTEAGDAWAKSVGGPLPRRRSDPDFGDV